jgi:hypothetical protein
MPTSTLAKAGALAVAVVFAKAAYSAMSRRKADKRRALAASPQTPSTAAGESADAFSTRAIQHDLSIGDAG